MERFAKYSNIADRPALLEKIRNKRKDYRNEKPLLEIRPLVKQENRVFHVKYQSLDSFMRDQELENYLVITAPGTYTAVLDKLVGKHACIYVADSKKETLENVQRLYDETVEHQKRAGANGMLPAEYIQQEGTLDIASIEAVVCLGGGVAMDAGKFISSHIGVPLYAVPTVLSVNAAFCYKAALRERDIFNTQEVAYNVVYKFFGLPEAICIDLDIITAEKQLAAAAEYQGKPEAESALFIWNMLRELNIAGAGDLLSILTATMDWEINHLVARDLRVPDKNFPNDPNARELLEKPFSQDVCIGARELLSLLDQHAEEIRFGKKEGIEFMARAYHWIAEQSWIMQHTMWESASEHGMFDHFENLAGTELTHGTVIALCVYFMSLLQINQHERAVQMIRRLGVNISLADLAINAANNDKITPLTLFDCLVDLKAYIEEINYRYTIISAKPITTEWVFEALEKYYQDFYRDLDAQGIVMTKDKELSSGMKLTEKESKRQEAVLAKMRKDLQQHQEAMRAAYVAEAKMRQEVEAVFASKESSVQEKLDARERILKAKADAYRAYFTVA